METILSLINDLEYSDEIVFKFIYKIDKRLSKNGEPIISLFRKKLLNAIYERIIKLERFELLESILKLYLFREFVEVGKIIDYACKCIGKEEKAKLLKRLEIYESVVLAFASPLS